MIQAEQRTIGDYTYTVRQMPATAAYTMLTRLIKLAGPSVKGMEGTNGKVDAIAGILGAFAANLDEAEVKKIVDELIKYVEVDLPDGKGVMPLGGKAGVFETHFHGGRLSEMFKVLGAVLEVNYADFFGGMDDAKELLAGMLASVRPSKSPSTFGGQPGA